MDNVRQVQQHLESISKHEYNLFVELAMRMRGNVDLVWGMVESLLKTIHPSDHARWINECLDETPLTGMLGEYVNQEIGPQSEAIFAFYYRKIQVEVAGKWPAEDYALNPDYDNPEVLAVEIWGSIVYLEVILNNVLQVARFVSPYISDISYSLATWQITHYIVKTVNQILDILLFLDAGEQTPGVSTIIHLLQRIRIELASVN